MPPFGIFPALLRAKPYLYTDLEIRGLLAAALALPPTDGFLQAIMLRMDAWDRPLKSKRDGQLLFSILALCGDENGESLLGIAPEDEDRVMEEVTEFIPACVTAIAAYWRGQGSKQISMPLMASPTPTPTRASTKVGRNEPCPCGSGKKFKKCCGKSG